MRIALDAFGSDHAPFPEVEGAVRALKENVCDHILLVGDENILAKELEKYYYNKSRLQIIHASQVITMEESASSAVRAKRDSSLVKAITLHKEGKADAVVSAGNTGAFMAASLFVLGRLPNIERPAIAIMFPTINNPEIILDVGANVDCEPKHLLQFGMLGSFYSKLLFNIETPKVALLNIGEEHKKGNELVKTVYQLLQESDKVNFVGNIEGKDLLSGNVDVIVCDGFVGNVMLKTVEGAAAAIFWMLKEQLKKDWVAKLGSLLSLPAYSYLKKKMDHSEHGGGLLMGLNGISVVAHGRSNAKAIKNAIRFADKTANLGIVKKAQEFFSGIAG